MELGPVADFCPAEKCCLQWVAIYLKHCVCDQVSLTLGLMSTIVLLRVQLYTITTVILVSQTVYYDDIRQWFRSQPSEGYPSTQRQSSQMQKRKRPAAEFRKKLPGPPQLGSARSLASSYTPTLGSYSLVGSHGGSYLDSHDQHSNNYLGFLGKTSQ